MRTITVVSAASQTLVGMHAEVLEDYLTWFHFCNASLQPGNSRMMVVNLASGGDPPQSPIIDMFKQRPVTYLQMIDDRLAEVPYLAGNELTLADIMTVFSLSTNRGFSPRDLGPYKNILAYLERCTQRQGYRQARQKGDPETPPLIDATVDRFKYGTFK